MDITEVRVKKLGSNGGALKAVASAVFDNCFIVTDIKVVESQKGLFISMPSKRTPDGEFADIVHPISSEFRIKLNNMILDKYNNLPEYSEGEVDIDEDKSN